MVEFSWIIKGSITTAPGRIQFSLIFIDIDTTTNTECYRQNSTINTNLSIGDGLYNPDIDDMKKIKNCGQPLLKNIMAVILMKEFMNLLLVKELKLIN